MPSAEGPPACLQLVPLPQLQLGAPRFLCQGTAPHDGSRHATAPHHIFTLQAQQAATSALDPEQGNRPSCEAAAPHHIILLRRAWSCWCCASSSSLVGAAMQVADCAAIQQGSTVPVSQGAATFSSTRHALAVASNHIFTLQASRGHHPAFNPEHMAAD